MIQHENWVEERARCMLNCMFDKLREVVEKDVATMHRQSRDAGNSHIFEIEDENPNSFSVKQRQENSSSPFAGGAGFRKNEKSITVSPSDRNHRFTVSLEWNEAANTCDWCVDGERYNIHQTSQNGLTDLFFGWFTLPRSTIRCWQSGLCTGDACPSFP